VNFSIRDKKKHEIWQVISVDTAEYAIQTIQNREPFWVSYQTPIVAATLPEILGHGHVHSRKDSEVQSVLYKGSCTTHFGVGTLDSVGIPEPGELENLV